MLRKQVFFISQPFDFLHTFHYITLHYITLPYITSHYITLHYNTVQYTTSNNIICVFCICIPRFRLVELRIKHYCYSL